MFFKDLSVMEKKKLRMLNATFGILYFIASVVVPIIIVGVNYNLFQNVEATTKLTAVGVICVIILGFYVYNKLKHAIEDLPQLTHKQQCFKFTIQMFIEMIPFAIIGVLLFFAKNETEMAFNTFGACMIAISISKLIDGLFCKYIKAEYDLRNKSLELVEIEKRKGLV
jgi:hypothetical protein